MLFNPRGEIERVSHGLRVSRKTDFETIVENNLNKWTNTLRSQIVKPVEAIFEYASQASCFNFNNGRNSAMFHVIEQPLGEVVRAGRTPTISESKMCSLVQIKAAADLVVYSVLSNTSLFALITETFRKLVYRAVDEYGRHDMKEASKTVSHDEPSIARPPVWAMRLLEISSDSELNQEPGRSRSPRPTSSRSIH